MATIAHPLRSSLLAASLLMACAGAQAQFGLSDLQIAGRALGFLDKPLSGNVSAGIVYTPTDPQSARAAQALMNLFGGGLRIGNITLKPILVAVADLPRAQVALYFLTDGISSADADAIAEAAKTTRTPCITTDLAQVRAGVCAMGVATQPRVEILVNRAAAAKTMLSFSSVFRMMITET
jgi:ABC-type uncharacterized transport system substrate-binding protein